VTTLTQQIRHLGCGFLHVDTIRSCAVIAIPWAPDFAACEDGKLELPVYPE
jgi:hypothetical protein